jgi:glycogen debranching enzyme
VAAADPTFSTRDRNLIGQRLYWRGPTWVNSAWLVRLGLVRLGYDEAAETLATRLASTIAARGLREYYNPYTGAGMGAVDFGWSSLILELIEGDPQARGSYLDPSLGQYADPGRPWTNPPNTSTS